MSSEEKITILEQELEQLKSENAWLKYKLEDLKRRIFGVKSERFIPQDTNQPTLFELPEEQKIEKPAEYETVKRKKPKQKSSLFAWKFRPICLVGQK